MPACPQCGEENPDRARFCWSCGAALEAAPRTGAEERKIVSVLFVDLVGFTAASEQADPEDVRARLRPYHERVKQEIERFGGTVEKFVGDAVMAVFGAPIAHEDDAERAVSSALRILNAIEELNEEDPGLELAVRGAVNTGEAMVTLTARPAQGEGIVAGDVVNTAARLQQHAPVGGIVVGEATYRATRDLFEYEPLEAVTAKGKAEAIQLWRANAPRRRFGIDVEPIVQTPFIGRDDDLALLQSTYTRTLRDASTQLVTITGEPGVGKTRLAAEFRRWVDDRPEIVFWRQGRSLPYGEGITYWALGEMVKAQAGILESDSPEEAEAKLAVAVDEAAEDPAERDWLRTSLAPLVGIGEGAAGGSDETFTAWRRFIEGIAAQRPLVLVFEDLHWADDALLAFVEHLVDWSAGVPLLVLCTARPELYERHPEWGGGKRNSNTISLSPLGMEDTTRLLAALLRKAVLPVETQAMLLEHAGGNPLYAEEFVRMLSDQGVLTREGVLRETEIRVPDTVQALIAARLDTLPSDRKALLHDAAVVGKVFWGGALSSMGDRDEAEVRAGLHELARKELVRSARKSSVKDQAEYSFWHALVRDVAYSQIPRAERVRKHVSAAEWIEAMAGERVTDHAELLAYHCTQALELAQALRPGAESEVLAAPARRFLVLAGDRAMSLDLVKAGHYFERALELFAPEDVERGNVLMKLAASRQGSLEGAEAVVQEALTLFRKHGNEVREGAALVGLSQFAFLRGDGERSRQLEANAISLLERHPPGEELAWALTRRAGTLAVATRPHESLRAVEDALRVVDELDIPVFRARLLQYRGIARHDLGDITAGVEDIRASLELARDLGDLITLGTGYSNLGSCLFSVSARESADAFREGIDFTKARGMTGNAKWLTAELTWPLYDLGSWDELIANVDGLLEDVEVDAYFTIIALPQKALVLMQRGRVEEAAGLVEQFLVRARDAEDLQVLVPAIVAAASVAVAKGELVRAASLVREVETTTREGAAARRAEYLPELVAIALAAGALDVAQALLKTKYFETGRPAHAHVAARAVFAEENGEVDAALELHEDAAARWSQHGFVLAQANALLGAGRCLLALGRVHEATSRLRESRELFLRLEAAPSVTRVDKALARATSVSA
jgi:class 3 adenylate cyclase/tetratricopeptide (TPR) repeat protein